MRARVLVRSILTIRALGACALRTGIVVGGLAAPTIAHADPKDDARRHFAAGLEAAKAGDYEIALQRFLAAQDAWPHPATLYNIAKAYTDLDDLPNALAYYRMYSDADPEHAADVQPVIAVLEARLGQQQAGPVSPSGPARSGGGPSTEELARLDAIAQELAALTEAMQNRSAAAPVPEPGDPTEPAPDPELAEVRFLEDAYERVVITASRVGQEPLDSPATVTVITADEIRLSGAVSIPDLLRRVVGVEVMTPSPGHSDVAIRGFQRKLNNKVLVLIDGRSTYLDFLGATFYGAMPIELEEIDRIEVIRGPGSAVYGANAVTGVINIITRTPGEGPQVVAADAGYPGIVRTSGVASGRFGATSYRLSAGMERHGRWAKDANLEDVDGASVETFLPDEDLALDVLRMNARVDRQLQSWGAVSVSGGFATTEGEFYNIGALPKYGLSLNTSYLRGDVFAKNLHLRTFWNSTRGRTGLWVSYPGERDLDSDIDNEVVDVEAEFPAKFETGGIEHQLNAGGGWRYKGIRFGYLEGGYDKPWIENHFQGFVNEQATAGVLSVVGSLRVDAHPLIPISQTVSPRGAVLWRVFERTSLRATAGSAYRAPSAIESYMQFALPTPADGLFIEDYGNVDLRPERITTLELGVHDESTFYHQADAVVYWNRVTDLVSLEDVTPAFNAYDPTNGGIEVGRTGWINSDEVYTGVGFEGEVEVFPTDGLDLFANVSLMQVNQNLAGVVTPDRSSSPLRLNFGASYRTPYRVDVSGALNYLSPQTWGLRAFDPDTLALAVVPAPLDARVLVSARVAVRPFAEEDVEVALTGWNVTELFGEGFYEHPEGQPVVGRLFGSVGWRF
ncbi:MAG: TonB-dependent receptor [Myxococcota bacterium]